MAISMSQVNTFARSVISIAAFCTVLGASSLQPAVAERGSLPRESRSDAINRITDNFFYQVNPELKGRKLGSRDRVYIREWNSLRQTIVPMVKTSREVCFRHGENEENYWEFHFTSKNSYDVVADAIFYSRYPEMTGKKLSPGSSLAREWSKIRKPLYIGTCGI